MTPLEIIAALGFAFVVLQLFVGFLSFLCSTVFDFESEHKLEQTNSSEKQSPTFITGIGKLPKNKE